MEIKRLQAFRGLQKNIDEIMKELDALYYPITSPRLINVSGTLPGDPTARAVEKILRLRELLQERTQIIAKELDAIETWIETLDDPELAAIIRAHYLLGDSWERCTQRILNRSFSEAAKYRVYRYFENGGDHDIGQGERKDEIKN